MKAAGLIKGVVPCHADTTFNVHWLGYVFTPYLVAYYRCLAGRWRKIALPILYQINPREDTAVYKDGATVATEELSKGDLRMYQVGCDHFGGIPNALSEADSHCRAVTSVWHMVKNIRKNQRKRGAPKISNHPFGVVLAYIYLAAGLPTLLMFHVAVRGILARVRGWGDGAWADYFEREYLYRAEFSRSSRTREFI